MRNLVIETSKTQALLKEWNFLNRILQRFKENPNQNQRIAVQVRAGSSYLAARLAMQGHPIVLIENEEKALQFAEDAKTFLQLFGGQASLLSPASNQLRCQRPQHAASGGGQDYTCGFLPKNAMPERAALLDALLQNSKFVLSTTWEGLLEKTFSKEKFQELRTKLKVGKTFPYSKLVTTLLETGYRRTDFVEENGEFSIRGAVLDFWSPNGSKPVRLVFKEETIESMHSFDWMSQRTVDFVPETILLPIAQKNFSNTILDFLPEQTIFIESEKFLDSPISLPGSILEISPTGEDSTLNPSAPIALNWELFKQELLRSQREQVAHFVFCKNAGERQHLEELLDDLQIGAARPEIVVAPLSQGCASAELKFALWSFAEMAGAPKKILRLPKFKIGRTLDSLAEIHPGDYVVHEHFGIGKYRGLERIGWQASTLPSERLQGISFAAKDPSTPQLAPGRKKRSKESEFLTLEYKGGDRLYVPISDFKLVQKYIGAEAKRPKLNSLDGIQWERIKQKVRAEVQELAKELLETAAQRQLLQKIPLKMQEHWNRTLYEEFVGSFPYEETADQLQAIQDVEKDLHSPHLMDRLICGDVGYGKTEIALRAAFLAVLSSKQVAMLVPTTILAEQHFKTFAERCAAFPIKVALLSRFQKPREQKKILEELKNGSLDILIGTHRLIQKDVKFKNLGLIIIDEEHRFGVQQKELLKKMKRDADFLSLSATPIPRTLSQALGGIYNISVIETPPEGRLPIETIVGPYDEKLLQEAIAKELARGGQIFYVHNRIATIEGKKRSLEKLFPNLRIGLAHGRMSADSLEKAMWNFLNRKWEMLLSTTIIESGLDIPSVNTLIVEDSEEFGLAQLYQLRGRIGREQKKATCILFFSDWHALPEDAKKRLEAIQEFSALGSGLKLAVKDLEIRGAGNLLGEEQHGWISTVGLELYCQLLSQEMKKIRQTKGMEIAPESKEPEMKIPEIELEVSAFIPEEYVSSESERIVLYKKMSQIRTKKEIEKLQTEFLDRFGPIPPALSTLFQILFLKIEGNRLGLHSILETSQGIVFSWKIEGKELPVNVTEFAKDCPDLIELLPGSTETTEGALLKILFKKELGAFHDPMAEIQKFLRISTKYVKVK